MIKSRSSRPEVFCKKDVLRKSAEFKGKHLCQSHLFNKFAGLSGNFIKKKKTLAEVLCCEFCEIFKKTFSYRKPPVATSANQYLHVKNLWQSDMQTILFDIIFLYRIRNLHNWTENGQCGTYSYTRWQTEY